MLTSHNFTNKHCKTIIMKVQNYSALKTELNKDFFIKKIESILHDIINNKEDLDEFCSKINKDVLPLLDKKTKLLKSFKEITYIFEYHSLEKTLHKDHKKQNNIKI